MVRKGWVQYKFWKQDQSVQFSHSVVSDFLWPHGWQHTRVPYPSPTPRAYSNSRPSSRWCHPTISTTVIPFSSSLQSFPTSRFLSNESVLLIKWPKYWSFSFSISPSNEYSGLISFRMNWFDLFAVQFSSVQSLSQARLFATLWITARQASLSITNSQNLLKLMPIESVMPSRHLILCCPLFLLPPIPPSIRVFSNESAFCMRWPK